MRSKAEFEKQRRIELRQARERELALLSTSRETADPRYVRSAVAGIWSSLLRRKLAIVAELPNTERTRLQNLVALELQGATLEFDMCRLKNISTNSPAANSAFCLST